MKTTDNWQNIKDLYEELSNDWFVNIPGYEKATLKRIAEDSSDSDAYCHNTNTIQLNAPKREIEIPNNIDSLFAQNGLTEDTEETNEWPKWKSALIHEVIHEYEKKVIKNNITNKGKNLHNQNIASNFPPPEKHDNEFYTSVEDRSNYFKIDPQELKDKI